MAQPLREAPRDYGKILTATSLGELKRKAPELTRGYAYYHRPLEAGATTLDLYACPFTSIGLNRPEHLPEGSKLIGTVNYESREAALRDLG